MPDCRGDWKEGLSAANGWKAESGGREQRIREGKVLHKWLESEKRRSLAAHEREESPPQTAGKRKTAAAGGACERGLSSPNG